VDRRRALITGGAKGMGKEFTKLLLNQDYQVWILDNDQSSLAQFKTEFQTEIQAGDLRITGLDLLDFSAVTAFQYELESQWGHLSLLINNAGVVFGGEFSRVELSNHWKTIDINLKSLITITHLFLPLLQRDPKSLLIQMASVTGLMGLAYGTTYSASKWGVVGFSEALREELRVTSASSPHICIVCPSYIDTGMFDGSKHPIFMPKLAPSALAKKILSAAQSKKAFVYAPFFVRIVPLLRSFLPLCIQNWIMDRLKVAKGMSHWCGRPNRGA
jgi:all-trans-retinol dehydrogenase (NAD+)